MSRKHQWEPPLPLPSGRRGQTCAVCCAVRLFFTKDGKTVTFYLPPEANLPCEEMEDDEVALPLRNPPPEE